MRRRWELTTLKTESRASLLHINSSISLTYNSRWKTPTNRVPHSVPLIYIFFFFTLLFFLCSFFSLTFLIPFKRYKPNIALLFRTTSLYINMFLSLSLSLFFFFVLFCIINVLFCLLCVSFTVCVFISFLSSWIDGNIKRKMRNIQNKFRRRKERLLFLNLLVRIY